MIEVENLHKSFGSKKVLDGVNLKVDTGETMVIIGRSGCGKSVLLKHMIGLIKPDSGSIRIDGLAIEALAGRSLDKVRMKFGMLFQNAALFDSMTIEGNLAFPLSEHTDMGARQIQDRVNECLHLVGLEGVNDLFPSEISGGMRKRVGLARALVMNPKIILYDEPTTGVDPIMADIINRLIIALRDQLQVTSVVVTHDMTSAYKVADKVAMLYNGSILEVDTPQRIKVSKNALVQQFIRGEAIGPIREGLPGGTVISDWSKKEI